jgi:hypothetical protein
MMAFVRLVWRESVGEVVSTNRNVVNMIRDPIVCFLNLRVESLLEASGWMVHGSQIYSSRTGDAQCSEWRLRAEPERGNEKRNGRIQREEEEVLLEDLRSRA